MADPLAPANTNPFDQLDPDEQKKVASLQPAPAAPAPANENKANPFDDFDYKIAGGSSTLGAFRRGAVKSALPALGSLPAMGAGAELGAAAGAVFGPFGAAAGGLIGAVAGGFMGSTAIAHVQNWGLSKLPDSWREAIGMDERQAQIDERDHSTASFLGGLLPFALTMKPGAFTTKGAALPENATAMQRIMANPVTARVFGGGINGGMELGQEAVEGQSPDWTKVAIATGFGIVWNQPTRIGTKIIDLGAKPTRMLLGHPEAGAVEVHPTKEPTVANAADVKVAGPGITEEVFQGTHQQDPASVMTAQEVARTEQSILGDQQPVHDIHAVARQMHPELMDQYDTLQARREEFRKWIGEFNTPPEETFKDLETSRATLQAQLDKHVEGQNGYTGGAEARRLRAQIRDVERERDMLTERAAAFRSGKAEETADLALARKHLLDTEYQLRDMAPEVRAAYGRAADAIGAGTVEPMARPAPEVEEAAPAGPPAPPLIPEPAAQPPQVGKPIAEQVAFIAEDVARQIIAAGRSPEEAEAAGKLIAARYRTRAARLGGAAGTPEELYRREGAEIRGPGGRRAPPAPSTPTTRQELAEFVRKGGEVKAAPEQVKLAEEFKPGPGPKAPEPAEHEITTTEVKPKVARGAAARDPETWSLLEFLTSKGGISPDERNISDLRKIFGKKNHFVPGFGQLVRPGGMSLDRALEAAVEARYIHDEGRMSGGNTQVRPEDLKILIDAEVRGQKQYRQGQEQPEKAEDPAEREHFINAKVDEAFKAQGIPPDSVTGKLRDRVIEIMEKEYIADPIDAWEKAVMEGEEADARAEHIPARTEAIPGWDVADDARTARSAGEATPQGQNEEGQGVGQAARPAGQGATEAGAEGQPQHLIPGVEPVSARERTQLEADRPLRGGDEPAGGMFDEEGRSQRELFQRDPAGPFYSAVEKTVDNAKLEKGSPEQWLGTIRNATGVKPEEMEWLGIADWLKEQKGPVTKQQVQDYIRANSIEVQEVEKGAPSNNWSQDEHGNWMANGYWIKPENGKFTIYSNTNRTISVLPTLEAARQTVDRHYSPEGTTKFGQYEYVMPGGENYRELLLTLPYERQIKWEKTPEGHLTGGGYTIKHEPFQDQPAYITYYNNDGTRVSSNNSLKGAQNLIERSSRGVDASKAYKSSHWDEPNILAHTRFNDRIIDGKKTLFIEEIQSDWHQRGRAKRIDEIMRIAKEAGVTDRATAMKDFGPKVPEDFGYNTGGAPPSPNAVPDAPFKTTWPELAMKRMIRYAAENGYEQVAWTPGDVQALRYPNELRKAVERIRWDQPEPGNLAPGVEAKRHIWAEPKGGGEAVTFAVNPKDGKILEASAHEAVGKNVSEVFGKDMAQKIMEAERGTIEGKDFVIGAHGMREFYDSMLPKVANKLVKKFDTKVGTAEIGPPKPLSTVGKVTEQEGGGFKIEWDDGTFSGGYGNRNNAEVALKLRAEKLAKQNAEPAQPVHTLPITESLRDAATGEGFPLFQGVRGKISGLPMTVGDPLLGKPIMTLTKDANASTFIHETGHQFLEELIRDGQHQQAPNVLRDDADTVLKWLGAHSAEDIKTKHHEKFARGFEQYLREGTAPSPELAGVFHQFKEWLLRIYETIKGLGKPINEDIRQVFDRMLAEEPRRTVLTPEREGGPTLADIHETDALHTEPHEAEAVADRVAAERARYVAEPPPEIANEIAPVLQKIETEQRAAQAGAQPAGEPGNGPAGRSEVGAGGIEPGPVASGGAVGKGSPEVGTGGNAAEGESSRVPGPEQGRDALKEPSAQLAPAPARLFSPAESQLVDKAGNIRIENLTNNEEVARAIRESAEQNDDFIGDRRGVITDGQVMELADALGMTFESLNRRKLGQAFNAEQVMAARKMLLDSATRVSEAMKKAAVGTDEDVMAYALAKDRHQMIQAQVSGITAEAGRALRAFRTIAGQEEAVAVDKFVKQATGKTLFQLRQEAQLGMALDTPQQVSKFMQDAQKRTFGRMIVEYWINGLLSGPATHSTNVIGNEILSLQHAVPETFAAALIGRIQKALGREGEYVRFGEVGARLKGMKESLPSAIKGAGQSFKSGVNMLLPGEEARALPFQPFTELASHAVLDEAATYSSVIGEAFSALKGMQDGIIAAGAMLKAGGVEGAPTIGAQYSHLGSIPDIAYKGVNVLPVGTVARLPGRFLSAADSFFGAVNYSMAKNARAYRMASEEGLTGTAFDARIAHIRDNPTEAMMSEMVQEAAELRLMEKGGKFLNALSQLSNVEIGGFPALKFVTPFVHVAGNILKQTVMNRTPFGLLSTEIRADLSGKNGNVAQDYAMARMMVGTTLAVTLGALAGQGYASGSGPTDPGEAAMWRLAGNQAHSVRIGDTWYGVQKLGPVGMLMSLSADLYKVADKAGEGEMTEAASSLVHAFSQNILDQSLMKGPAELLRAINDSDRYGEQYVRNFLSAFVPYSVGMAQMAKIDDPYSRQTRTIIDAIRNKIPGHLDSWFESGLFPKRDIWGQEMLAPTTVGGPAVTGIYLKQLSEDPVNQAMLQVGIGPGPVARKIRNVDLTDRQYDDFARLAGRMTKQRLDVIVKSPDYRRWPNNIRATVIQEVINQSRESARGMVMMKYPQIVRDAVQARKDAFTQEPEAIK